MWRATVCGMLSLCLFACTWLPVVGFGVLVLVLVTDPFTILDMAWVLLSAAPGRVSKSRVRRQERRAGPAPPPSPRTERPALFSYVFSFNATAFARAQTPHKGGHPAEPVEAPAVLLPRAGPRSHPSSCWRPCGYIAAGVGWRFHLEAWLCDRCSVSLAICVFTHMGVPGVMLALCVGWGTTWLVSGVVDASLV